MARYPKARWRPVVDKGNDPPIIPVGVILHVSGGEATSLFEYFDGPSGGIESQMHLNRACEWEQYRDTTQEADANYRGNSWIGPDGRRYGFISVETQGGARGEWSPPMLAEIKDFLLWASAEHGFPLRRCPTVQPDSPTEGGVGYHVMFGAGAGTYSWSNAAGKVCPGPDRIRQFDRDLIPWMASGTTPEEDDMPQVIYADKRPWMVHHASGAMTFIPAGIDPKIYDALGWKVTKVPAPLFDALRGTSNSLTAGDAAIRSLAEAMAKQSSLTADEIEKAVREGIASGVQVTGTFTVTDKES